VAVFNKQQISAYRFWIQGYPRFYEPLVAEYFRVMGYRVQETVTVRKADIQRVIEALFDGHKKLGPELDQKVIIKHLRSRKRIQPDLLVQKDGRNFLVELKSWGGYRTGIFDLGTAQAEFVSPKYESLRKSAFLLVDWLDGQRIDGKILVVSARSPQHEQVMYLLSRNFNTTIQLLYLDEIFATPQLAGTLEKYFQFLDAAVAELKVAIGGKKS